MKEFVFTSESVSEGHPDKVCDRISDSVLDAFLTEDPFARVAVETLATTNRVVLAGEVRGGLTDAQMKEIAREAVRQIGYEQEGFHWQNLEVDVYVHSQSADIAMGVDEASSKEEGAGDQGIMFGYACRETPELMPAPIQYAHQILHELADLRHNGLKILGPDAKSQVSLLYHNNKPIKATSIVVSTQHAENVTTEEIREIVRPVILRTLPEGWMCDEKDLPYTPITLSRALIWKNGKVDLFLNQSHLSNELRLHLGPQVYIHPLNCLTEYLLKPQCVQIDTNGVSAFDRQLIGGRATIQRSPILSMKAVKNHVEIEGMRKAHQWDGIALGKFRSWLLSQNPNHLDEITAAEQLETFRRECPAYKGPSFPTISGFGANGAIVHYHATPASNQNFTQHGLYLVDSGGQYLEGTTDVTRVFPIGPPTDEQKRAYTLVLKGHLRLAQAVFPIGTTGHQLDVLARYDVWQYGLNYEHGTGHGVGSYLSVHEGPQGISPRANATPLQPGMILSNEPGYYKTGEFGIRIENLMVVQESKHEGYLCFETLTQVPYESTLIDYTLLTDAERNIVFSY